MKVRIGISIGALATPDRLGEAARLLEKVGIHSLWLSEVVYGPLVEPFVGMTHALAVTENLKVGTGVAVLPGRHPVLVAKQLASLAALAPRRVLPVFGLRPARSPEAAAFPVPGPRAAVFDESMEVAADCSSRRTRSPTRASSSPSSRRRSGRARPGRSTSGWAEARLPGCAGSAGTPTAGWSFDPGGGGRGPRADRGRRRGGWPRDRGRPLWHQPRRRRRGGAGRPGAGGEPGLARRGSAQPVCP